MKRSSASLQREIEKSIGGAPEWRGGGEVPRTSWGRKKREKREKERTGCFTDIALTAYLCRDGRKDGIAVPLIAPTVFFARIG